MIKEFEQQIILTAKTNELLEELKVYTEEVKKSNDKNLSELKDIVIKDMQEIVDYCIKMNIPKYKTGWTTPSEVVLLREGKNNLYFKLIYDTQTDKYEWYVGYYSTGVGYVICNGLFCTNFSFSNYKPVWSYGFLNHNDTESEIVQYICSNWTELKAKIIEDISSKVAKHNEQRLQGATNELNKQIENLVSSSEALA